MSINATFRCIETGMRFNQVYPTKRGFLISLSRSSKFYLVDAVDTKRAFVVRNENLEQYRRMK